MDATACRIPTASGVYVLWSNDPPDDACLAFLSEVFVDVAAEVVSFPNPLSVRIATYTFTWPPNRADAWLSATVHAKANAAPSASPSRPGGVCSFLGSLARRRTPRL